MGDYLSKYGYKEGMAVWKFVLPKAVIYRNKHNHALKLFWEIRDRWSFKLWVRTPNGWEFAVEHTPRDKCICGREYDDNPSKEPFRFQQPPDILDTANVIKTISEPALCQICYYKAELKAGRWAPKNVKRTLGLET
jgi:hypothetical protein